MRPCLIVLGLAMASQPVLANSGSTHFFGQVPSGTCSIEVIDASTGLPASSIYTGNVKAAQFKQQDDEAAHRSVGLCLTPGNGCTRLPGVQANATLIGDHGGAGASGMLFALEPGGATGLALIHQRRSRHCD